MVEEEAIWGVGKARFGVEDVGPADIEGGSW